MAWWTRFYPALRRRLIARIADAPDEEALLRAARLLRVLERADRRRGCSDHLPPPHTR